MSLDQAGARRDPSTGSREIRLWGGESLGLISALSPREGFPEVLPNLQPGSEALGWQAPGVRAPAPPREGQGLGQDRGLGLAWDVMRPSYVTGETCEHTQACGERNLGPEPHKTGVAFTACLCCQLPPAAAIKAASSPVPVPLYGLTQCPSPTEL